MRAYSVLKHVKNIYRQHRTDALYQMAPATYIFI